MILYFITYELRNREKNYSNFYDSIKSISHDSCQCMTNAWLIYSDINSSDIYNELKPLKEDIISENYDITEKGFNTLRDRVCDLLNDSDKHYTKSPFVKDIIEMNKELSKYGYGCIDYWQVCEESEVIDFVRNNDCKYYENGEVF